MYYTLDLRFAFSHKLRSIKKNVSRETKKRPHKSGLFYIYF